MNQGFIVIIPARYESTRLPGKPLVQIGDKTLIEHVYLCAKKSSAKDVIIATDDERIESLARSFNAEVIITSHEHSSGTDRLREAVEILKLQDDEIVVNLQGDEFGMDSVLIDTVARALIENKNADMASLCTEINDEREYLDPNTVKLVIDQEHFALYFSRSPIPWGNSSEGIDAGTGFPLKHIGIYSYSVGFLKKFADLQRPQLEKLESLEQLRALYYGFKICVEPVDKKAGVEINTESDLARAFEMIKSGNL